MIFYLFCYFFPAFPLGRFFFRQRKKTRNYSFEPDYNLIYGYFLIEINDIYKTCILFPIKK